MEQPRFRTDLVSSPVEENGQRFVDVTDPDNGSTFRFYEVEYAVACAMDGSRDVGGLADWARAELGLEPSRDELETVISTLGALGYLAQKNGPMDVSDLALGSPGRSPLATPAPARAPAEPVDLGQAGRSPIDAPSPRPPAPDFELGAAGTAGAHERVTADFTAEPSPQAFGDAAPPQAFGAAEPPPPAPSSDDVSVDLSQHLSIGADDVKEAVRQSRTMDAVMPPPDIGEAIAASKKPSAEMPGSTPIELPERPPGPSAVPTHEPAPPPRVPAKSSGTTLILLILLLIVAIGGTAYYFLVYAKTDDTQGTKRPRSPATGSAAPDKKPEPPSATLAAGEPKSSEVLAPRDGKIAWIEAEGTQVDAGAIIAKYDGFDGVAKKLTEAVESRDRYQAKLDKATARGSKKAMADAEANVKRKKGDIADIKTELETFAVKAEQAGEVSPAVSAGDKIEKAQKIATLEIEGAPSASFEVSSASKFKVDGKAEVVEKDDPSVTAVCSVVSIEDSAVTVACPDSGLEPGAVVVLK